MASDSDAKNKQINSTENAQKVKWDTSQLKSAYANVCNVTGTREEIVLNFGVNQAWERSKGELEILLTNRIILSPFAAKRLLAMLTNLVLGYEQRFGELSLDVPANETLTKQ